MSIEPRVTVFYGPTVWFEEQLNQLAEGRISESLLDIVDERDEAKRQYTHVVEGQEVAPREDPEAPELVVAESNDYASLNEHAITNFASLIRLISPVRLILQNPPLRILMQLERVFETDVRRYKYPAINRSVLARFRDEFDGRIIGQPAVKETLLAALYPLTTVHRSKPVVLMFYGPSGVGKTETAHFVNDLLGGSLMRKQFSMFQNDRFASYVFGGAHSEVSFAHELLDRESGVILIDEFDKANTVFHAAFYQLFDDGVFEDKNYRVDVGPALIICTSNYTSEDEVRRSIGDALYSRFDSVVQYRPLSKSDLVSAIDRITDARLNTLAPDEESCFDVEQLRVNLRMLAGRTGNVRKLKKLVDEIVSLALVRALLADAPSSSFLEHEDDPGGTRPLSTSTRPSS